jgi:hypothetical protein
MILGGFNWGGSVGYESITNVGLAGKNVKNDGICHKETIS